MLNFGASKPRVRGGPGPPGPPLDPRLVTSDYHKYARKISPQFEQIKKSVCQFTVTSDYYKYAKIWGNTEQFMNL